MDKDSYETYEYISASTSDGLTESNQFFVVQDDGTFLNQFSLVEGENLYANSFLLQAGPSAVEKMDEDVVVEGMCEINQPKCIVEESKISSPYTEITLTETQYHTLEQKGWILLETVEKMFLLDMVGLHDITDNEELIQNLKREIELDSSQENSVRLVDKENDLVNLKSKPEIAIQAESIPTTSETLTLIKKDDGLIELKPQSESDCDINVEDIEQNIDSAADLEANTLRIKTNLSLKDIPDKIMLGKTASGKKLVARVKSKFTMDNKTTDDLKNVVVNVDSQNIADSEAVTPTDSQFRVIVDKAQKSQYPTLTKAISESLLNLIVNQLMKMPSFKKNDYNLMITKEKKTDSESSISDIHNKLAPCLVTGSIKATGNAWKFHHQPHILFQYDASSKEESKPENILHKNSPYNILHVHIMEMKKVDNIERICMTVNRRYLPIATPKIETSLACTECARVFKRKEDFDEHLENHTVDAFSKEAMVVEQNIKLENGESKKLIYSCVKCEVSFDRLSNTCQKHSTTQALPNNTSNNKDSDQSESKGKLFQCKMCINSYLYSASLSKHIKEAHVKVEGTVK